MCALEKAVGAAQKVNWFKSQQEAMFKNTHSHSYEERWLPLELRCIRGHGKEWAS